MSPKPMVTTALALTILLPTALRAQVAIDPDTSPRPVGSAVRTAAAPHVDGILGDAVWGQAPVMTDFVQSQPSRGMPATERTEVRILYDDEALYVAVRAFETEPAYVIRSLEHDYPGLSTRDADIMALAFDTFLDRRNSFILLVNPYGAIKDGQTFNDSRVVDFGWDGVYDLVTTRDEGGYSVEIAIPWSTLRFSGAPGPQEWGFNALRRVRRKAEDSYWAPLDRRDPIHRMSRAGTLNGFEGLMPGSGLRVKPYTLIDNVGGASAAEADQGTSIDAGLDLKYGVTPTLTMDLTVNTDFSQVEADQAQVNLTRFPLFFPEQREFFLENSGSFVFGDVIERSVRMGTNLSDFSLFQSRRIGLDSGRPIPIRGGGRISGSLGPFEIGFLNMQTGSTDNTPSENFTVARLRREVGARADVGVLFTHRLETGDGADYSTSAWGIDANARPFGSLILNSYLAGTFDNLEEAGPQPAGESESAWAGRFSASWRDQFWNVNAQIRRIGDAFDPGVGFVRRRDVEQVYFTVGTHHTPLLPHTAEINPYLEVNHVASLEGRLLTRRQGGGLVWDLLDGSRFEVKAGRRFERLEESFTVQGEGFIDVGDYSFDEYSASFASSAARPLSVRLNVTGGGYFSGDRRSVSVTTKYQPSAYLGLEGRVGLNRIELPGSAPFDSNVFSGRVKAAFSTTFFASGLVQYIELTDELVSNLRVNWIHAPLSDVFLVFTERRGLGEGGVQTDRLFTLKVTRLFSF